MRLPAWLTANRVAAISGALTGLAAFIAGLAQILPGTWPNFALAASGLLVKAATVIKFLHGSQSFDKLEAQKVLALFEASGSLQGQTEGVKAQGFEAPQDPATAAPEPAQPPVPTAPVQAPAPVQAAPAPVPPPVQPQA